MIDPTARINQNGAPAWNCRLNLIQQKFQMKFHQLNGPNSKHCQNDAPAWSNQFNAGKGVRGVAKNKASSFLRLTLCGESLQENGTRPTPKPDPSYDPLRREKAFKRGARETKARRRQEQCQQGKDGTTSFILAKTIGARPKPRPRCVSSYDELRGAKAFKKTGRCQGQGQLHPKTYFVGRKLFKQGAREAR